MGEYRIDLSGGRYAYVDIAPGGRDFPCLSIVSYNKRTGVVKLDNFVRLHDDQVDALSFVMDLLRSRAWTLAVVQAVRTTTSNRRCNRRRDNDFTGSQWRLEPPRRPSKRLCALDTTWALKCQPERRWSEIQLLRKDRTVTRNPNNDELFIAPDKVKGVLREARIVTLRPCWLRRRLIKLVCPEVRALEKALSGLAMTVIGAWISEELPKKG